MASQLNFSDLLPNTINKILITYAYKWNLQVSTWMPWNVPISTLQTLQETCNNMLLACNVDQKLRSCWLTKDDRESLFNDSKNRASLIRHVWNPTVYNADIANKIVTWDIAQVHLSLFVYRKAINYNLDQENAGSYSDFWQLSTVKWL